MTHRFTSPSDTTHSFRKVWQQSAKTNNRLTLDAQMADRIKGSTRQVQLNSFQFSSSKKETTPGSKSKENSNLSYLFHFQQIYFRLKSNFRFRKLLFLISHEFILLRLIALLCLINLIQQIIHSVLLNFQHCNEHLGRTHETNWAWTI